MEELLHGDNRWLSGPAAALPAAPIVSGGITSEAEEAELEALNTWMEARGLPRGSMPHDFSDAETGEQKAVFDLAWPNGVQEEFSQPAAVLLNESVDTIKLANQAGFRCFTSVDDFKTYIDQEIHAEALA